MEPTSNQISLKIDKKHIMFSIAFLNDSWDAFGWPSSSKNHQIAWEVLEKSHMSLLRKSVPKSIKKDSQIESKWS